MNLAEVLTRQAVERGAAPALIARRGGVDVVVSFADLAAQVEQAAAALAAEGVCEGDRVLVFQPMSIELYVALLALFRLGAVAMFLDPSAGREHIERCCALGQPRALIASVKAHALRLVSAPLRRIPVKLVLGGWVPGARRLDVRRRGQLGKSALQDGDGARGVGGAQGNGMNVVAVPPICPVADEAEALLTFTSGSTGLPKAAVRSHGFLLAQHRVLEGSIALETGELDLATLPVFVLANLASGVTSLLPDTDLRKPGSIEAGPVVRQMEKFLPTRAAGSPAFFEQLLDEYEARPQEARACSLRKVYLGGAAVFPSLLRRMKEVWPLVHPVAVYGSTEAEPIAHIDWDAMTAADLRAMQEGAGILAGKPVPEIEVRLSAEGEIQVAGAHVLPGYLNGAGDAETKIREGGKIWHRTGDAGRFDTEGRLWLLGRCSAVMAGEVYPFTVECAAMELPWVRRCGCVEVAGKRVLAVELRPGMTRREEEEPSRLAWAKLDRVVAVRRLPVDKRHNAKVDYAELRRMLDGG